MKQSIHRSRRSSQQRAVSVMIGIAVNVLLAYIAYRTGLPIYLDTVGTIGLAALGGLFPGIMTAIFTNAVCSGFNHPAIYFGGVNALIAIYTAWFVRSKSVRRTRNVIRFILTTGTISGVLSAVIQWYVLGGPQIASVNLFLESSGVAPGFPKFLMFMVINILLNTIDKGLSFGVTQLVLRLIPKELRTNIRNSGWQQRPLTAAEMKSIDSLSVDSRFSLKQRLTFMVLTVSMTLTVIISITGLSVYFRKVRENRAEIAQNTAEIAAEIVDAGSIGEFVSSGAEAQGYAKTSEMLSRILAHSTDVNALYVLQVGRNESSVVFDLTNGETPARQPGDTVYFPEEMQPYQAAMLVGEEIGPVESKDISGWRMTAYSPIRDVSGKCRAYAAAEVSMTYLDGNMVDFLLRVCLMLIGFYVLILAYALWVSGIYMVYPMGNIVSGVEHFISAGTDQEALDEAVRMLRAIDIHTGDEVERLYRAVCDMAVNQTEQMRSIRRFSEHTARMQDGLIITMADLVENRDSDTGAHIQKTAAYVKIIVEGLKEKGYYAEKITPKFISDVVRSAPLHDVGKINIPDSVLNKPGKLTPEEYEIIKTHTTAGKLIIEKAISTVEGENYLKEARNMAAYHHERWDGKGYPEGLHGEVIPLAARIMAVADVFDALASPRVYKPAFPLEKAISIIQEGAGTQFDPKCVEVFMEALPEVREILNKYTENR